MADAEADQTMADAAPVAEAEAEQDIPTFTITTNIFYLQAF